jgi:hypothetical protein
MAEQTLLNRLKLVAQPFVEVRIVRVKIPQHGD